MFYIRILKLEILAKIDDDAPFFATRTDLPMVKNLCGRTDKQTDRHTDTLAF